MTDNGNTPNLKEHLHPDAVFFNRLPANFSFFVARDVRKPDDFNTAKRVASEPPPGDGQVFCEFFYKRISKCY